MNAADVLRDVTSPSVNAVDIQMNIVYAMNLAMLKERIKISGVKFDNLKSVLENCKLQLEFVNSELCTHYPDHRYAFLGLAVILWTPKKLYYELFVCVTVSTKKVCFCVL